MMVTAVAAPAPHRRMPRVRSALNPGLELYLREVANLPPLSVDEEERLTRGSLRGDLRARDALVRGSLRLVPIIAVEYLDDNVSMMTLIEHGNLGLIRAAEVYRVGDGPFCTFAAGHVCLAIALHLKEAARPALPVH
jgi:DNA-directed RNA polymerase sigma subunit (sigma70/sigma32)